MDGYKICFKCKEEKQITDFYQHKEMADGRLNKCKACAKKDVRDHAAKNRRKIALRYKIRQEMLTPEQRKNRYLKRRAWRIKDWRKDYAWYKANTVPTKPACEDCGKGKGLQRHHENYSLPDVFITLCRSCHFARHGKKAHNYRFKKTELKQALESF